MKYSSKLLPRIFVAFVGTLLIGWFIGQSLIPQRVEAQAGRQSQSDIISRFWRFYIFCSKWVSNHILAFRRKENRRGKHQKLLHKTNIKNLANLLFVFCLDTNNVIHF